MPASELSPCCSGQTGSAPQSYHKEAASEVSWRAALRRAWDNYSLATGLSEKAEEVQVATMLTVVGEEAREVFSTLSLDGSTKATARRLDPSWQSLRPTANRERTSRLSATDSIGAVKSQGRVMINTGHHYESWPVVVISSP